MLAPAAITAASFLPAEAVESLLLSQELALSPPLAGTRQRGGLRDEAAHACSAYNDPRLAGWGADHRQATIERWMQQGILYDNIFFY